jgi:hypothetical protein
MSHASVSTHALAVAQHEGTGATLQQLSGALRATCELTGCAQHGAQVPAIAAIWQQHRGIQNARSPERMVRQGRVTQ